MKIKEIFLLFLLTSQVDLQNITILSISICEIIENFYTKYSRNVDIVDIGGSHGDLVNKIMENLNNSMTVKIQRTPQNPSHWITENPSIFLFQNMSSVLDYWTYIHYYRLYTKETWFLFYIHNVTLIDFIDFAYMRALSHYFLFLKNDNKYSIYVYVNNARKSYKCFSDLSFVNINTFNPDTLKWKSKEIFIDIYMFMRCKLFIGIDMSTFGLKYINTQYDYSENELSLNIFQIFAAELYVNINISRCHSPDCYDLGSNLKRIDNIAEIVVLDHRRFNEVGLWNYQILYAQCT